MKLKSIHTKCSVLLLFFSFSFFTQQLQAQNAAKTITGKVVDENGKELTGVNVALVGTATKTQTSADGMYKIDIPTGKATLLFTYIGYEPREIAVNNSATTVNVSLNVAQKAGEDVVVVGYNTVKKKDLTGAVAGINQNDIKSRPVTNALQAMQGKVSGVDITSNERPGQVGSINIRGVRSLGVLGASNSPLFVVDGIPLNTGGIEYINPNDIENIDILKDASATAIYGSKGANGVVIVTTKQGKTGKMQLSFNSSLTTESIVDKAPAMSAAEAVEFRRWAYYYSNPITYPRGDAPTYANDKIIFAATSDPSAWANINKGWASGTWDGSKVSTTDWKSLVSQQGLTVDHTLSVSGGTSKIKAYGSFGYLNNKGTSIGQKFTRYSGKASVDIQATNWFSMGSTVNITNSIQEFGQSNSVIGSFVGSPATSIYESARRLYTYAVPFDSIGGRVLYPGGDVAFKTSVNEWDYTQDQRKTLRAFGSLYAQVNFGAITPTLKGIKYRMNFGPDFSQYQDGIYIDGLSAASSGTSSASLQKAQTFSYTIDNLLYYDKSIKKHSFGVTLLQSATKYIADPVTTTTGTGIPFASQKWNALNQSVLPTTQLSVTKNSDLIESQLYSFMGRLNYGYDDKYLLTVSARRDGASQLTEGFKYTVFPSAAFAWRVSNENFMKNVNFVNDLKFRVGIGKTGNSSIPPYSTKAALNSLFYPFLATVAAASTTSATLANKKLKWEETTQSNFGLDFTILNKRIMGSFDVYKSNTKNILMRRDIPTVTGYNFIYDNVGETANKGMDLSLTTVNINNKNFRWNTTYTASWQKDHIVTLSNGKFDDINNNWFINQPLGVIYGIKANGIWHISDSVEMNKFNANLPTGKFSAGNVRPIDQNGDYKIDANNDRIVLGSTRPRWVLGMSNSFSYKNFEISAFIYGRLNYLFNTGGEAMVARASTRAISYYTENNQNAEYQKPIYSTGTGDLYSTSLGYQKASFVKIRNISMSYNFTGKTLSKVGMSSLRAFLQIANPGMLYSKIKFLDMDVAAMTSNRGITFGVNAGF